MVEERKWVGLVTGATSGIGRAVAIELASACNQLLLAGRSQDRLDNVREAASKDCGATLGLGVDLADSVQVTAFTKAVMARIDRLDVLIHGAGQMVSGLVKDARLEDFEEQFRINVLAPFAITKALLPLLESARGQVVFVNSSVVFYPGTATAPYAATKHALKGFADHLRQEVNQLGIRVLSVFPGRTATPLQEKVHAWEGKGYVPEKLLQPEDVASSIVHALTMPRTAEITDIMIRPAQKQ